MGDAGGKDDVSLPKGMRETQPNAVYFLEPYVQTQPNVIFIEKIHR
jgi:hypothetical protein